MNPRMRLAASAATTAMITGLLGASAAQGPDWRTLPYFDL